MTKILMALTWAAIPTGSFAVAATPKLDREKIERLTGLKGSYNEKEGVFKVTFPRIDIKSTAANYK